MQLIADLHLHSKYSRAVSPQMVISEIAKWARMKGIGLVGAPDWTHPLWFRELKQDLIEAGDGIFAYKLDSDGPKFILSSEISSIYAQGGKSRRIHNLVLAPSFAIVEKINQALRNKGANLFSDGRPIVGFSSIELCDLVFSASKDCLIIPCHAWTPWFSLYGSRSGFDSLKECFEEFSDQIFAVETGLSSDPAMNWRIGELDKRSIVSFSDAHSGGKLGREATVFEVEDIKRLRYEDIRRAIMNEGGKWGKEKTKHSPSPPTSRPASHFSFPHVSYTIEFYPEEGKYHYTGHRKCGVKHSPEETKKLGKTCPVCGRELTVGVMHRVEELATRTSEEVKGEKWEVGVKPRGGHAPLRGQEVRGVKWENRPPYVMLVPLGEILSESLGAGVSSQIVETEYNRMTTAFGSEFEVLLKTPVAEIAKVSGEKIADGILRVRSGQVFIDPGYDGVFGTVKIWGKAEEREEKKQMSLF